MKSILFSLLITTGLFISGEAPKPKAATPAAQKVDMNAILKEVMKLDVSTHSDHVSIAFWAPYEFFQAAGRTSATPDKYEEIDRSIAVLKNYQIFLVRRSYKDEQGLTRVIAGEDLLRTIVLKSNAGVDYHPMKELPMEIAATVSAFKRGVEANSQGIEYATIVFSNKDKAGLPIVTASKKNKMDLTFKAISPMGETRFSWSTPLDSLSAPQSCPTCAEKLSVAWNYCPWDGTKLPDHAN